MMIAPGGTCDLISQQIFTIWKDRSSRKEREQSIKQALSTFINHHNTVIIKILSDSTWLSCCFYSGFVELGQYDYAKCLKQ